MGWIFLSVLQEFGFLVCCLFRSGLFQLSMDVSPVTHPSSVLRKPSLYQWEFDGERRVASNCTKP